MRRLAAWPIKALAWALVVLAFLVSARAGDTLARWMEREFLP